MKKRWNDHTDRLYSDISKYFEKKDTNDIIQVHHNLDSPIDCLTALAQHCIVHQKTILHDYNLLASFSRICNLLAGSGKQAFLKATIPNE